MVLEDHMGLKLCRRQLTDTINQLIEDLEAAYDNVPNMFSIQIHRGGKFQRYPGRMYVSGRVDILDMVDIDLFTVVALNMMVLKLGYTSKYEPMFYNYLKPLTSLDEGLYVLACEEDVCCLGTLVRSFKLIEVYIQHGVTALDSYLRAPRFRATLEEITDEPGSIAANRIEKMLLLTWHESSETTKEPVFIDDVMRQLSFNEIELDGEAGFANVAGSGVNSSGLSHDESFGVDDLDLNINESELILSEVSTQKPIVAEVSTQEPIVVKVSTEVPIMEEVGTQEFSMGDVVLEDYVRIDAAYETEYDVQSSEDAGTDDDDDGVDEDFLVYEENEIVEPDVDVHLFGENVDVINANGFDSDPSNDVEKNYKREEAKDRVYLHSIESRRNLKLYKNDGVRIRARCDGKVLVFTILQGTGPTGLNHRMEAGPSGSSNPTTRSKKKNTCTNNGSQASPSFLDALDKGDLYHWVLCVVKDKFIQNWVVRVNTDIPVKAVQDQLQCKLKHSMLRDYVVELQSTNPNTTVKIAVERNIDHSLPTRVFQRIYICLGALKLCFRACIRDLLGLDGAFMKGPFPGQVLCLGDDIDLHPNLNFTFISERQKVGRPRKKRKRSKHEDELFVKDGKLSRKGRTSTCQSCENTRHNKAICKGQGQKATTGGNNVEASGSASRQTQEAKPTVGQDGTGGSGADAIIGLSVAAGKRGASGPNGVGVASQGSSHSRWTKRRGLGSGYLRDYVRVVAGTDDGGFGWWWLSRGQCEGCWWDERLSEVCLSDSDSELLIPTSWSDESKNKKWQKEKGTGVMKDKVSQKNVCEEEVLLNNNIGKQIGDFVDMPSEAVKQGMDDNVPDEIDGAKGEHVPNHVVKKGNLEFLVCKEVANLGVNELVDKGRPLKRKKVFAK
nr:hypothetical protein [Tanacetum cinerariifolium]